MQSVPASGSEDQDERRDPSQVARIAFVATSALALVAFVLLQVVVSADQNSGAAQAKKLMAQIRAEVVDAPLTAAQLEWPLEAGDGRTITLAQLPRDKIVFLNFWATWCAPCRDELPSMFRLRQELQDRRFMMIAVSYDEQWADIRTFFQKWVGRLPADSQMFLVKDPNLEEGRTLRETFGTTQIPDSYVISNGRVLARFVNSRNWTDPSVIDYFEKLAPELTPEGVSR